MKTIKQAILLGLVLANSSTLPSFADEKSDRKSETQAIEIQERVLETQENGRMLEISSGYEMRTPGHGVPDPSHKVYDYYQNFQRRRYLIELKYGGTVVRGKSVGGYRRIFALEAQMTSPTDEVSNQSNPLSNFKIKIKPLEVTVPQGELTGSHDSFLGYRIGEITLSRNSELGLDRLAFAPYSIVFYSTDKNGKDFQSTVLLSAIAALQRDIQSGYVWASPLAAAVETRFASGSGKISPSWDLVTPGILQLDLSIDFFTNQVVFRTGSEVGARYRFDSSGQFGSLTFFGRLNVVNIVAPEGTNGNAPELRQGQAIETMIGMRWEK